MDARRHSVERVRSDEARSRDRQDRQGRRSRRIQWRRPTRIICAGFLPTIRSFRRVPGAGARRKSSTAARSGGGRNWPTLISISSPPFSRFRGGLPHRFRLRPIAPRLARRRDGRPLHRRDRNELILFGAARCDAGAGAAGNLQQHRRGRSAPLQAVLPDPDPLSGRERIGRWRRLWVALRRLANPRTTNSPTPITPPTRSASLTTAGAWACLCAPRPRRLPRSPRRARGEDDLQSRRPSRQQPPRPRRRLPRLGRIAPPWRPLADMRA